MQVRVRHLDTNVQVNGTEFAHWSVGRPRTGLSG